MPNDGPASRAELLAYRRALGIKRAKAEAVRDSLRVIEDRVDWTSKYAKAWRRRVREHRRRLSQINKRIEHLEDVLLRLSKNAAN